MMFTEYQIRIRRGTFLNAASTLLLLVAFTMCGSRAFAEAPGNLGPLTAPASVTIGNTVYGGGSVFLDAYSFSVTADAALASILASVSFMNVVGISGFGTSLWSDGDQLASGVTTTTVDPSTGVSVTTSTINYTPLLSGPPPTYEILAGGMVVGPSGSYGGNLVLSPIPEPEIYAMLAAGLGLMGFVARCRKQQLAAA